MKHVLELCIWGLAWICHIRINNGQMYGWLAPQAPILGEKTTSLHHNSALGGECDKVKLGTKKLANEIASVDWSIHASRSMSDQYKTIVGIAKSRLEIKKSRFIGLATGVSNQDAIKGFLDLVQQKHTNASHYCYAYTVGAGCGIREYATDAGEPTHSAGPPILTAVKASGLSNVISVVVRYYGGINLGVGGLIRAYGRCARECLGNAKIETRIFYQTLRLRLCHAQIGPVVNLCRRVRGDILNVEYDEHAIVHLRIRQGELKTFRANLQGIGSTIEAIDVTTA